MKKNLDIYPDYEFLQLPQGLEQLIQLPQLVQAVIMRAFPLALAAMKSRSQLLDASDVSGIIFGCNEKWPTRKKMDGIRVALTDQITTVESKANIALMEKNLHLLQASVMFSYWFGGTQFGHLERFPVSTELFHEAMRLDPNYGAGEGNIAPTVITIEDKSRVNGLRGLLGRILH